MYSHIRDLEVGHIIDLGGALGLAHPTIMRMKDPHYDMIASWLRRENNVLEAGEPTWRVLVNALRDIGQEGIARRIEESEENLSH